MSILEAFRLVALAIFTISFAYRNYYNFRETYPVNGIDPLKFNTQWHRWQAVLQASVIVFVATYSFELAMLFASFYWLFFDGVYNKLRGTKWFYVGETSTIDKLLQKTKKPELVSMIVKLSLFKATLLYYVIGT